MTSITEQLNTVVDALTQRADAYMNDLLTMGGSKDATSHTTASVRGAGLTEEQLTALYVEDEMSARIVNLVVRHALRRGWDLALPGSPAEAAVQRKAYLDLELELGVPLALAKGAAFGRLRGGAVTWIGVDDGEGDATLLARQATPLDFNKVERVRFLHTFTKSEVQHEKAYRDPFSPKYRETAVYRITPLSLGPTAFEATPAQTSGGILVHESRVILWPGAETEPARREERSWWDDSVLERAWDALHKAAEDMGAKSRTLNRISQMVFFMKNLASLIVANEPKVNRRLSLINGQQRKGASLVMDLEERVEQITQPISSLDTVIAQSYARVGTAGGIPPSVFVGAPTETDQLAWDEEVRSYQSEVLRPRHERITKLLLVSKSGPTKGVEPETWDIVYRPLHEPTPEARAELRKKQAETDAIEIDKGIIPPEAVALHRHTMNASGEGEIPLDGAEVNAALERRKELAKRPPKDNAELGTVGARDSALDALQKSYFRGEIPKEAALARLELVYQFSTDDALRVLMKPEGWTPTVPVVPGKPGPAPEPAKGVGAGAPQGLPGFDDGGNPKTKALPPPDPEGR